MSESILERIGRGDPKAVEECLDRYGGLVWSLARRLSYSAADAEDAAQDAFVAIWKAAARFDATIAPEAAFVAMIARRRIVDRRRQAERQAGTASLDNVAEPSAPIPEESVAEIGDETSRVRKALDTLDPERRRILELSIMKGISHDGISRLLKLPLGTVKSHARRGLLAVKRLLGEVDDRPGDPRASGSAEVPS